MKNFVVYALPNGTILRTGLCQDESFELQAMHEGEGVIEGEGDALTQRVDVETGTLVPLDQ